MKPSKGSIPHRPKRCGSKGEAQGMESPERTDEKESSFKEKLLEKKAKEAPKEARLAGPFPWAWPRAARVPWRKGGSLGRGPLKTAKRPRGVPLLLKNWRKPGASVFVKFKP